MADDDRVAAYLAEVTAAAEFPALAKFSGMAPDAVPRLVAAVEAVLKLAAEWDKSATATDEMAARAAERGADWTRTAEMAASAQERRDCATALREAISRALLGEDGHDG